MPGSCGTIEREVRGVLKLPNLFFFGKVGDEALMVSYVEWGAGMRWSFRSQTIL